MAGQAAIRMPPSPQASDSRDKKPKGTLLRMALADRDKEALDRLRHMLLGYGHEVVVACQSADALVRGCRDLHPHLVVIEMEMVPNPGALAALVCEICEGNDTAVIAVSTSCTAQDMEEVKSRSCVAHLLKPLTEKSLVATISLSLYHFEVVAAVCRELAELRNTLEARKMIDRAKSILMARASLSEAQAHERLQELASSRNMKMAAVADFIIEAELVFSKSI